MGKVTKNRTYYAANAKRLRAKQRRYAAKHPTKIKKWKQEEYRRDPQRVIARHRKFKTGWTPEEYRMAFARVLGHVDESVKILLKMADYLVYWRS